MKTVGITGAKGFIGTHLKNFLSYKEDIAVLEIDRTHFLDEIRLTDTVRQCDCIVHLAAMNRHGDPQVIYDTNLELVQRLINACEASGRQPHILFSSSIQEENDNPYGRSKKEGRERLEQWAKRSGGKVTGMIIPNVFGPFGNPYYNSVVATFCHQLTNGEQPVIQVDGRLKLIYVNELVADIFRLMTMGESGSVAVPHQYEISVSELLAKLESFKAAYLENGVFPSLAAPLDLALFNTFRCYIPHDHYPTRFKVNTDNRGSFVEITRAQTAGQFSFSTTKPGITRGNHYHTRKAERFAVIKGKASIQLRRIDTDEVIEYLLDGDNPAYVDMPIWFTHNITNIGDEELVTLFWINEPYDPADPDTYFINV